MEFPEKLTRLLADGGLTDRKVARAMKISPTTVGRWKEGTSRISLADAVRLAKVLGVDLSYLANDEQDRPSPPLISEDEAILLRVYRASRLCVDDAIALFTQTAASGVRDRPAHVVDESKMEGPFGPIIPHGKGPPPEPSPPEPTPTMTGKATGGNGKRKPSR